MAASTMKCGVDTGILLEAGTNELEILIIEVAGGWYGVNVAKVREVLEAVPPTRLPECHRAVEGSVNIRGRVVELVNLAEFFGADDETTQARPSDRMLIMEFNQQLIAFRVHAVDTIIRTSWANVQPMPRFDTSSAPVTSIVPLEDRMVLMLDFEAIGMAVGMTGQSLLDPEQPQTAAGPLESILFGPVVFAEDSATTHKLLQNELRLSGCPNYRGFHDGRAAWEHLCELAAGLTPETIREKLAGVISDVEMPQMDGFSLTRSIREHPVLGDVPVVLFSSIVSKDNEKKGLQVGADAQIAKGNYRDLVQTLAEVIRTRGTTQAIHDKSL
ncbi:MAG: chemotaxis protein CheV [Pirellulales bacterium]|nr:chemotaxis protein CheV [Pirellulales bacterium]